MKPDKRIKPDNISNDSPADERRQLFRRRSDYQADHFQRIFDSFETVGRHVLLLDGERNVLYRSGKVDALVSRYSIPLVFEPTFCPTEPGNAKQFMEFVEATRQPADEEHPPSCMLLLNRGDESPLLLSGFPLADTEQNGNGSSIMVLLCDTACVSESQWKAFQKLFGLTAAELRLCLALADGLSLAEFEEKYGVTINTVRNQLKSIFGKTNTRRQGDLVRLIFLLTRI